MSRKSSPTPNTIAALRAEITDLKSQLREASQAGLPAAECEAGLRRSLAEAIDLFEQFKREAADHIARGEAPTLEALFSYQTRPETIAKLGIGAALSAYGIDKFVTEATAAAAEIDKTNPITRLSAVERHDRLRELHRQLYAAELAEESLILETGEDRRLDANAAAVLGIPFDEVEHAGLLDKEV